MMLGNLRKAPPPPPQPVMETAPSPIPLIGCGNARRWQIDFDHYWTANETTDTLPPGLYRADKLPNIGICLRLTRIDTDDLIELPDSPSQAVLEEIREFWQLKERFVERGFIHKRGVLLWGPPGSGKTATVNQLIAFVVRQYEGVGFFIDNPHTAAHCLQMLRRIEPTRPSHSTIVCIERILERCRVSA